MEIRHRSISNHLLPDPSADSSCIVSLICPSNHFLNSMGNMAPWSACVLIITSWLCACVLIISFGLHILVSFVQGGHVELSSFHVSTTKRPIPNDSLVFEALALASISVIHSMLDQSEIHHHSSVTLCVTLPIFNISKVHENQRSQ